MKKLLAMILCATMLLTSAAAVAEGANIVLIDENSGIYEPAGYPLHYGKDYTVPDDAPSYVQLAKERGARLILAKCVADGVLDENGEPIPISTGGMSYGNDPMVELYAVTQEQFDAVMALIDSTTSYIDFDQNVINIITEEAAGYFSGGKSVEEASKHIQSRVSLYIQEQK